MPLRQREEAQALLHAVMLDGQLKGFVAVPGCSYQITTAPKGCKPSAPVQPHSVSAVPPPLFQPSDSRRNASGGKSRHHPQRTKHHQSSQAHQRANPRGPADCTLMREPPVDTALRALVRRRRGRMGRTQRLSAAWADGTGVRVADVTRGWRGHRITIRGKRVLGGDCDMGALHGKDH